MAVDVKTYNPVKVQVSVGLFTIAGFAPGTFIELVPDAPPFKDDYGVDGEPQRWASRSPFDTLTLSLEQSSPSNFILSNQLNLDQATHAIVLPVMILDNNTEGLKTMYVSARGYIEGPPRIVFSGETPVARQWRLRLLNTFYNTKGIDSTPAINI